MNLNKLLGSVGASFVGLLTTYLGTIFNSNLNHVTVTLYFVCAFLAIALVIFIYDDFSMRFNAFSKKLLSNNQEISTKSPSKKRLIMKMKTNLLLTS